MEQDKMLAVIGSPGSGKTTTAVKLARTLAARKKNVILVLCDPFIPVIPALLPAGTVHDTSLGFLLTAPGQHFKCLCSGTGQRVHQPSGI